MGMGFVDGGNESNERAKEIQVKLDEPKHDNERTRGYYSTDVEGFALLVGSQGHVYLRTMRPNLVSDLEYDKSMLRAVDTPSHRNIKQLILHLVDGRISSV